MAYPYTKFNFQLEVGGTLVAGFSEITGVSMESGIIEYREGSDATHVRKVPGLSKYGNITLKRGFTDDTYLSDWRKTVINGAVERRDGAIILLNEQSEPALRWNFTNAWPSKLEGAAMNATANEIAIETVELAVESVELG